SRRIMAHNPQGKTDAAARSIPVHPSVMNILARRLSERGPFLINGLEPGGPDRKRSWYVSKAFGRFRAQVGIAGRLQDFHALRNTFIEAMEGAEVAESTVKLLVGHKRPSLTFGHYSKGERVALRRAINRLSYGAEVMKLIRQEPSNDQRHQGQGHRSRATQRQRAGKRKPQTGDDMQRD